MGHQCDWGEYLTGHFSLKLHLGTYFSNNYLYLSLVSEQVKNGNFYVPCKLGGTFDDAGSITWPSCMDPTCDTLPAIPGFTENIPNHNTLPIYTGGVAYYQCSTTTEVLANSPLLEVPCLSSGDLDVPATPPTCAAPVECSVASFPAPGL